MFAILPFLCFLINFVYFCVKSNEHEAGPCWRSAFLLSSILWGVLATVVTELLSVFHGITFGFILGSWGLVVLVSATICLRLVLRKRRLDFHFDCERVSRSEILILSGVSFIIVMIGIVAIVSPPNTWDSMTYHMSRVVHWIQNRDVAFYPTHILRQLHQNPWAEFAILHFQILSGGDRLANLVQWFSMIGSILGISLVTKQLGGSLQFQILAAVISATIPMGILQGSSTQNDYVTSFWLVCFVYSVMVLKGQPSLTYAFAGGASLGLAILAKATAYLYTIPFLLWFGAYMVKARRWQPFKSLIVILVVASFINVAHFTRNFDLYGHFLGPGREGPNFPFRNDIFTLPSILSNVVRNVGLHLSTPISKLNISTESGIRVLHHFIGIDVNDPRTTWPSTEFHIQTHLTHEDYAGNPLHLILIVLSVGLFFLWRQQDKPKVLSHYSLAMTFAFLLFCFYLRWQPWHSRLHLPLFLLWSPFVAVVLSRFLNRNTIHILAVTLIVASLPWVLFNESRPLFGSGSILNVSRTQQYFVNRPNLREPYMEAVRFMRSKGCHDIGLFLGEDDWEYPIWVLVKGRDNPGIRIRHVGVQNLSMRKSFAQPLDSFKACGVISLKSMQEEIFTADGISYTREFSLGSLHVFVKR